MLTSAQLGCEVFDRLTGRQTPKLVHPTAKAFNFNEWSTILGDSDFTHRDADLVRAAKYIGHCLRSIRESLITDLFEGLSQNQIVELAIADANRGWNIFRWKLGQVLVAPVNEGEIRYLAALGKSGIPVGPGGTLIDVGDANNALVDGLPYWFAEAADTTATDSALDGDMILEIMHRGHIATNLMQVFKSIWQEVLWEPWSFTFNEEMAELIPSEPDDLARWRAWDWREQAMLGQISMLNRNLEKDLKNITLAIPLTATGIGRYDIEVGPPSPEIAAMHRSAFENIQKSYVVAFLDEAIAGQNDMTPILLESIVCILQDLINLRLPRAIDPIELDKGDPLSFSCSFSREQLISLVQNALKLSPELSSACIDQLTSDPFGDLGNLFTIGLWHQPLVRSRDGTMLLIVAGALVWGSPIRRIERWLQMKSGNDLSDTSAGHRYEAILRTTLTDAIAENAIFANIETAVGWISQGQAGEEIDVIIRLGGTIIVGEIKCLLGPSEPIERYDYVRKLEAACSQAARKARWLAANPAYLKSNFGVAAENCRILPLVIVNQGNGMEWEYADCPITDARFLELFLSTHEYVFGGKLYGEPGKAPDLFRRAMYSSAAEVENAIPSIFRNTPVMDPFRDSIEWTKNDIPMPGGMVLRLAVPQQNSLAYQAAMDNLLAAAIE